VRYCGVDVSAKAANQQLVTLEEASAGELVPTFFPPGTPEALRDIVAGFEAAVVAVDGPSGPRRDLLGPDSRLRAALGLPDGRYERMRVCDALLFRRGLPLYPVPPIGEQPTGWAAWIGVGFAVFAALDGLGLYRPTPVDGAVAGRVGGDPLRDGRLCETYPDAVFCTLLGYRPPSKRTREGVRERIAALEGRGVDDAADGGLLGRTLDELDACAAAYAAYALATGRGSWVGAPAEGVIVLPVAELRDRYARRPSPARKPVA